MQLRTEPRAAQCFDYLRYVLMISGLEHEVYIGGAHRDVSERALVIDLLDIRVHFGETGRHFGQCTGQVPQLDGQARQSTGAHHPALDDIREHEGIDVSAAQHQPDPLPAEALAIREDGGQANRTDGKSAAQLSNAFFIGGGAVLAASVIVFAIEPVNISRPVAPRSVIKLSPTSIHRVTTW